MGDGLFAKWRWGMKHRMDFQSITIQGRGTLENSPTKMSRLLA